MGELFHSETNFIIILEDSSKQNLMTRSSWPHIWKLFKPVVNIWWLSLWRYNDYGVSRREQKVICWRWYYPVLRSFIILLRNTTASLMGAMASQIPASPLFTQPFIQGADQGKHISSASLAFVRGIHRGPGNSLQKWPVTRKMFPFDDVIMVFLSTLPLLRPQYFGITSSIRTCWWHQQA